MIDLPRAPREVMVKEMATLRGQRILYPIILNIVRTENWVREPFSARCLAKHMPSTQLIWLQVYLSRNAATSQRDHLALFVRVYRGWYRLNDL